MDFYQDYMESKMRKWERAVLVKNVHPEATKDTLLEHFNKFGSTENVFFKHSPKTGDNLGVAVVLMRNKSEASRIVSLHQGAHQVSDPENGVAKTCNYLGNVKSIAEKGPFKLLVCIGLPFTQSNERERILMGRRLRTSIWEAFNQFSMTSYQLMVGGEKKYYSPKFEVRFAKEEDKENVLEALQSNLKLEVISFTWDDTREKGYKKMKDLYIMQQD